MVRSVGRMLLAGVMATGVTCIAWGQTGDSDQPAAGVFLLAAPTLRDPNFAETIVFLIDYSQEGAVGLVINRPTSARLDKVFPELETFTGLPDLLYVGGPVEGRRVLSLVESKEDLPDSREIIDQVRLCWSLEVLNDLVGGNKEPFRVYAGYAGWAPGQLDMEIARSDWRVVAGDRSVIFAEPEGVWQRLIDRESSVIVMGYRNRTAVP